MLTVLELQRFVRYTLGGEEPPSEMPTISLINEAGEILVNARRWNWLNRPETYLNLSAAQNWIALPTDFGEIVALELADTLNGQLCAATMKEVMAWRSTPIPAAPTTYYWALEYLGSAALGPPTPRIALHQAPLTSQANAARLVYRAGWTELSSDADVAVIPSWIEPLYREILVAVARGRHEEDVGTVSDRLEPIMLGALMRSAERRDAVTQANLGQIAGGAVGRSMRPMLFNPDTTVGTPVSY